MASTEAIAQDAASVSADAAPFATPLDLQRPGYKAMWVGICLECLEFAVFFVVYFTARWYQPQAFQDGAARLWTLGGLLITLVMVTSGYLLTRMLHHLEAGRRRQAAGWLAAAFALGLCYPLLKGFEWQWNQAQGLDAQAGIFVVVYYYLTINHFIHASWGLLGMAWTLLRMLTGSYADGDCRGPQSLAIYWHATDLVWLMIFALFYAFA
ncbi:cytochrome c oxidase subunit 3 [Curvibacter sp. APW13]|uniref:cytochrome c oxidase subunit 3 n=1 Tax=Curvibacter sp. APW13 TaxID=3077236 RepID=UPI0028E0987D|nr:cytochrome c oxidase subunit 3 [Curvibacter sp. APW13]MDT8990373.1 cytochrome c oxidase subunit 3 [Curvibacter sp. APW13]